jgi:hypothetical protein
MGDSKLVDSVLAEDWSIPTLRLRGLPCEAFEAGELFHERDRQAALGHRALREIALYHPTPPTGGTHDGCALCAIVAELRGGK